MTPDPKKKKKKPWDDDRKHDISNEMSKTGNLGLPGIRHKDKEPWRFSTNTNGQHKYSIIKLLHVIIYLIF